jgi:hypothetical protein
LPAARMAKAEQPAFSRLARPLTNFSGFPSRYLQDTKPKKRCDR